MGWRVENFQGNGPLSVARIRNQKLNVGEKMTQLPEELEQNFWSWLDRKKEALPELSDAELLDIYLREVIPLDDGFGF